MRWPARAKGACPARRRVLRAPQSALACTHAATPAGGATREETDNAAHSPRGGLGPVPCPAGGSRAADTGRNSRRHRGGRQRRHHRQRRRHRGLAELRARLRRDPPLEARPHRHRQRRRAGPRVVLQPQLPPGGGGHADRRRRGDVRHRVVVHRPRARRGERREAVGLRPRGARRIRQEGVLRRGQPRRRALRGQGLRRRLRRLPARHRRRHRRAALEGRHHRETGRCPTPSPGRRG